MYSSSFASFWATDIIYDIRIRSICSLFGCDAVLMITKCIHSFSSLFICSKPSLFDFAYSKTIALMADPRLGAYGLLVYYLLLFRRRCSVVNLMAGHLEKGRWCYNSSNKTSASMLVYLRKSVTMSLALFNVRTMRWSPLNASFAVWLGPMWKADVASK